MSLERVNDFAIPDLSNLAWDSYELDHALARSQLFLKYVRRLREKIKQGRGPAISTTYQITGAGHRPMVTKMLKSSSYVQQDLPGLRCGKCQRLPNVIRLEERITIQNFFFGGAGGEQVEKVADTHPQAAYWDGANSSPRRL